MATSAVSATSSKSFSAMLTRNLKSEGLDEKAAAAIGGNLVSIEDQLLEKYSKVDPNSTNKTSQTKLQNEIDVLQVKYQRAQRVYQLFTTMLKNAHDMMMNVIRNMRLG